jgi:hypothetical protein
MNDPSLIESESETAEEVYAYLRWLKSKVAASMADSRPVVGHDESDEANTGDYRGEGPQGLMKLVWRAVALADLKSIVEHAGLDPTYISWRLCGLENVPVPLFRKGRATDKLVLQGSRI